jgi:single-stranded-DNA-specific exonuclease
VLDLAYRLRTNEWNGEVSLQLELVGSRPVAAADPPTTFVHEHRSYACRVVDLASGKELRIRNAQGKVLTVQQGQRWGWLRHSPGDQVQVDVSQPYYFQLIKAAVAALEGEGK